jgi:hypothetical protein
MSTTTIEHSGGWGYILPTRDEFIQECLTPINSTDDDCPICLTEYTAPGTEHEAVLITGHPSCNGHVFGHNCIGTWCSENGTCPLCRTMVLQQWDTSDILTYFNPHEGSNRPVNCVPGSTMSHGDAIKLRREFRGLVREGIIKCTSTFMHVHYIRTTIIAVEGALTKRGIEILLPFLWDAAWQPWLKGPLGEGWTWMGKKQVDNCLTAQALMHIESRLRAKSVP